MNSPIAEQNNQGRNRASASHVILLSARECFAIDAGVVGVKHYRNDKLLAYEIEQYLALDGEEMAVAVCPGPKGFRKQGLILVASKESLAARIDPIQKDGGWIAGITSSFLLSVQYWISNNGIRDGLVLSQDEDGAWNGLALEAGVPKYWRWGTSVNEMAGSIPQSASVTMYVFGNQAPTEGKVFDRPNIQIHFCDPAIFNQAQTAACSKWKLGRIHPWADFRASMKPQHPWRPLYPGLLAISTSLLLLLMACIGYVYVQNGSLSREIADKDQNRTKLFERLYPGQSVPVDVPGRLRSDLQRLEQSKQDLSNAPTVSSVVPLLITFLNRLPQEGVFRIDSLRIKSPQITGIDGSVKSLSDFESIVGSLRQGGFEFPAPSINQMKDGFSLRLEKLTLVLKDSTQPGVPKP